MSKSCITCSAVASPDLQLQYCAQCQSALYCSNACQRKDWKEQHKQICKLLNVGHGDMQIRTDNHTIRCKNVKEDFECTEGCLDKEQKRFFRLFQEAQKMKKFVKRETKYSQEFLLFHSLDLLVRSDSQRLLRPNSFLLVMLLFVDPNVLHGDKESKETPLHFLATLFDVLHGENEWKETPLHFLAPLADHFDYSTHKNQLILAKQLIELPLHITCCSDIVTNLDFLELLLKAGANPNAQDDDGLTPLMYSIPDAPGAAKFLLNWPSTTRSGESFLGRVRSIITDISNEIECRDNTELVQHQFLLQ